MKDNYSAWEIHPKDFYRQKSLTDKIRFLLRFAILAPSSHNSQPWKFTILDDALFLSPDQNRFLPISDPTNRHLYIALGCVIENFCIAADYYGLTSVLQYFPSEFSDATVKILLHSPSLSASSSKSDDHPIFSILKRRSNRNIYEDRIPQPEILEGFKKMAYEKSSICFVTDHAQKIAIARFLVDWREKEFDNKEFRREMARYKRNNFTRSYIGMPGFTMGFKNFASILAPLAIRYFNVIRPIKMKEIRLLTDHTPVFGVITSPDNTEHSWLQVGRSLEKIWIEAEQQKLQLSINALPASVDELQRIIGISERPQIFFRLGYAAHTPPHSPRLGIERVFEGSR